MFLWPLQITITLTESGLLIFFAIQGWKIAGMGGRGLNPQPQPYILVLSQVPMTSQPRRPLLAYADCASSVKFQIGTLVS